MIYITGCMSMVINKKINNYRTCILVEHIQLANKLLLIVYEAYLIRAQTHQQYKLLFSSQVNLHTFMHTCIYTAHHDKHIYSACQFIPWHTSFCVAHKVYLGLPPPLTTFRRKFPLSFGVHLLWYTYFGTAHKAATMYSKVNIHVHARTTEYVAYLWISHTRLNMSTNTACMPAVQ